MGRSNGTKVTMGGSNTVERNKQWEAYRIERKNNGMIESNESNNKRIK